MTVPEAYRTGLVKQSPCMLRGHRLLPNNIIAILLGGCIFLYGAVLQAEQMYPLAPPDTRSPRNTLSFFIATMDRAYQIHLDQGFDSLEGRNLLAKAARCFDLEHVPESVVNDVGVESALLLKEVLDRIEVPPMEQVPEHLSQSEHGRWLIPNTEIQIEGIREGPRQGEYLFSADTVDRLRIYYNEVRHLPYKPGGSVEAYEDYVFKPGWMVPQALFLWFPKWSEAEFLGQKVWQWIGLVGSILVGAALMFTAFKSALMHRASAQPSRSRWSWTKLALSLFCMAVVLMVEYIADHQINLSGQVNGITKTLLRGMFFVTAGWSILLIGDRLTAALSSSSLLQPKGIDDTVIRLVLRTITVLFIVLLLWNASDYLGMSLTAVFASAGIVGLAVALAARETLANFFGGISILVDRPFKPGDFIILDSGERGQVVEIGMRSTKIITRDDIQISIPNSLITSTKVVNESAPKRYFRVRVRVGVAYDTDVARVGELLLRLAHENVLVLVDPEPQIRFLQFGDSALQMELQCWARRPEDKGLLVHQLNSAIYRAFKEHRITIPFPQRDVHMVSK